MMNQVWDGRVENSCDANTHRERGGEVAAMALRVGDAAPEAVGRPVPARGVAVHAGGGVKRQREACEHALPARVLEAIPLREVGGACSSTAAHQLVPEAKNAFASPAVNWRRNTLSGPTLPLALRSRRIAGS